MLLSVARFANQQSVWMSGAIALIVAVVFAGEVAGAPKPGMTGLSDANPSAQWLKDAQADIARSEYEVTWSENTGASELGEGWQAPNRAQNLRVYFTDSGPRVVRRTEETPGWVWGLEVVAFGGMDSTAPLPPVGQVNVAGARIEFHRGGLVEWYENKESGLEQGFELEKNPTGENALSVTMAVRGNLAPGMMPDGRTIEFITGGGVGVMRYGKLTAFDASGRVLPSTMELVAQNADQKQGDSSMIKLEVDVSSALFPVTIDPIATSVSWTAESNQASSYYGQSVAAAGDVNGDGYGDVVIGAPNYDNGEYDEGSAFLYLGSASGLGTAYAWHGESNLASAYYGTSVSTAGDVNGDGYADIVVGAYGYYNGESEEGIAYIYHGSASGLGALPAWSDESNQTEACFGYSVSTAGDVNGDGYSDVIVGANYMDNFEPDEGRAFVYYGSATGLVKPYAWSADINQISAYFGCSVSTAGDVNGDGYADVIVGASRYDHDQVGEGAVFGFYGSASGLSPSPAWSVESDQSAANFGCSVAPAGDVNGDGFADVIVGANKYDHGETDEGAAFVYLGSSGGLSTSASWHAEGDQDNAQLGNTVSTAGDVNSDGYADVVAGAFLYDGAEIDEGLVVVHFGSAAGLSIAASWATGSGQNAAQYGCFVSTAGDVNGDGYSDVLIGANTYDNDQAGEGRAFVFTGSPSGPSNTAPWSAQGNQSGAQYGISVSKAGDVNGDGYADFIVGAPFYDGGFADGGGAFLYLGSAAGAGVAAAWTVLGEQGGAMFGETVSTAGDVNGDGYDDVVVGARLFDNGEANEGKVYVYHGSPSGAGAVAAWSAEGGQINANFGCDTETAGDVNGDGISDLIIGAFGYDGGGVAEGRAYVYHGSLSGLNPAPAWTSVGGQDNSMFGSRVSSAGDVNGDGYGDVAVGAWLYDNGENDKGRVIVFHGSPLGLGPIAVWTAEGDKNSANFGSDIAAAGDVNGDGYGDLLVGANRYSNGQSTEGRAFAYHGSAAGLAPTSSWIMESNQTGAYFGNSTASAGDVNGDGFSDVIVGSPYYDQTLTDEGRASLYAGSASGLVASALWTVYGGQENAQFGGSVDMAGDVNGDGFSDLLVGAKAFTSGESGEGGVFLYYGNGEAGCGLGLNPRQRRGGDTAPIAPMSTAGGTNMRVALLGRTPFGRAMVKTECEVKPFGTPFDGAATIISTNWADTGTAGSELSQLVNGLDFGMHHWRVRLLYHPVDVPCQQKSRWMSMPWNGWEQWDFKIQQSPPSAPSNPGAVAIGQSSITWTWQDNSGDETGFAVYSDPGSAEPVTLQTTTAADSESWQHTGLGPNTQHIFRVLAVNLFGASEKTVPFTAWTLAATPVAPVVDTPTNATLNVAVGAGDGNPAGTEYALFCTTTGLWLRADGVLVGIPSWQTRNDWGTVTVGGLLEHRTYAFSAFARNAAGIATVSGNSAPGTTLDGTPPSGSVVIEGGAVCTRLRSVYLSPDAVDTGSGVAEMRFTTEELYPVTWSGWVAYDTGFTLDLDTLPGAWTGEKTHRVYAQFRDGDGNTSTAEIWDDIVYDASLPLADVAISGGAARTGDPIVTLDIFGDDGAGCGLNQMRFSENNADWTAWEPASTSRVFVLSPLDGPKPIYMQLSDLAGNIATAVDTIVLDTVPPTAAVTLAGSTPTVSNVLHYRVLFSEPVAPTFDSGDVAITGDFTGSAAVGGTDPDYTVTVTLAAPGTEGVSGIAIGVGVTDAAGLAFAGAVSQYYSVISWPGFMFTLQPQKAYTGDTVCLDATVAPGGSQTPVFQWRFDDGINAVQDGPAAAGWTLANITPEKAGTYWCAVTYGGVVVETPHVSVQVRNHLWINQQPVGGTVALGKDFTFRVGAVDGYPPYHYQWKKTGVNIPESPDHFEFTLGPAEFDNSGMYRVEVFDSNADALESAQAGLTVGPAVPLAGVSGLLVLSLLAAIAGARALRKSWR